MISKWFLVLAVGIVEWLAGVFGVWDPPRILIDMSDGVADLLPQFASLGVWVDWAVIGACVAASVATWGIVLLIKLIRAVAAHIPAFGGAGD